MARPLLNRLGMSARTSTVVCATLLSIPLFGCATGEASSPPDDGNPMVAPTSTGAGGAILPSGTGGITPGPVGGQVGAGGYTPAPNTGGSQPVSNGGGGSGSSGSPSAGGQTSGGAGPGSQA